VAFPRWLVPVNRHAVNPLTRVMAGRLPWFGVVRHVGRRSGRLYRTPVNAFPAAGGYVVAVSYGRGSGWVRNVLAAGGCVLEAGGRCWPCSARLVRDRARRLVPWPARLVLHAIRVDEFLVLTARPPVRVPTEAAPFSAGRARPPGRGTSPPAA
jgi:deazaflavin-dependent oxidoreductase (nitroreductase family)